MYVSIKDIAKAPGIPHSTVSHTLSYSPLVKAESKARIQRLAQEMGCPHPSFPFQKINSARSE
jgi:LacI family transcriptional regulator